MSDLSERNIEAMREALRSIQSQLEENKRLIFAQNAKIASLVNQLDALNRSVVHAAVSGSGRGPTA